MAVTLAKSDIDSVPVASPTLLWAWITNAKESPMKLPPKKQPKPTPLADRLHHDQRLRAPAPRALPMLARKPGRTAETRRSVVTLVEWPKP